MNVTRVVYYESDKLNTGQLVSCSVVLDDCLRLNDIKLFKDNTRGYFLVLPNKSDIYKEVSHCNKGKIVMPNGSDTRHYGELFHPVDSLFYSKLLGIVQSGYKYYKETGRKSYRP